MNIENGDTESKEIKLTGKQGKWGEKKSSVRGEIASVDIKKRKSPPTHTQKKKEPRKRKEKKKENEDLEWNVRTSQWEARKDLGSTTNI